MRSIHNSGIECDKLDFLLLILSTRLADVAVAVVINAADAGVGCPCLVVPLIVTVNLIEMSKHS